MSETDDFPLDVLLAETGLMVTAGVHLAVAQPGDEAGQAAGSRAAEIRRLTQLAELAGEVLAAVPPLDRESARATFFALVRQETQRRASPEEARSDSTNQACP